MRWTRAKNAGQLGLLAAVGFVPFGFHLSSLSGMTDPIAVVSGAVVPLVCSALVVLATVPVARSPLSPTYTGFIVGWTALGALTLGAVALLLVTYEMNQGPPPSNPALIIGGAASVGSAFGLAFGLTDAHQRRAQRRLERANGQLTVLNRVLRHNIRNAMTVVQGRARFIRQQAETSDRAGANGAGDGLADHAVVVEENAERLLGVSEHARHIDAVIGPDDDAEDVATTVDLVAVAEGAIERLGAEHPAADFVAPAAAACRVCAHPLTEVAVSELIENAVVHGGDAPRVSVSVRRNDEDGATLRVDDDGPGISPETVETLRRGYETSMRHADGLGLWLVRWVVDRSVADLDFESGGDGQTVTIRFDRVADAAGEATTAADDDPNDLPDADATGDGRPSAATADSP